MNYYDSKTFSVLDEGFDKMKEVLLGELHRLEKNRTQLIGVIDSMMDDMYEYHYPNNFTRWVAYRNSGIDTLHEYSKDYHYTLVLKIEFVWIEDVRHIKITRMKPDDMCKAYEEMAKDIHSL